MQWASLLVFTLTDEWKKQGIYVGVNVWQVIIPVGININRQLDMRQTLTQMLNQCSVSKTSVHTHIYVKYMQYKMQGLENIFEHGLLVQITNIDYKNKKKPFLSISTDFDNS